MVCSSGRELVTCVRDFILRVAALDFVIASQNGFQRKTRTLPKEMAEEAFPVNLLRLSDRRIMMSSNKLLRMRNINVLLMYSLPAYIISYTLFSSLNPASLAAVVLT